MKKKTLELTLDNSDVIVSYPSDLSVSDILWAQRASSKDTNLIPLYLMERLCKFNGDVWKRSEIQEKLSGRDYLKLAGLLMTGEEDYSEDDEEAYSEKE